MSTPLFDRLFPDPPLQGHVPLSGEQRKYSGMDTVLARTPDEYRIKFIAIVQGFAKGHTFTVEDVTAIAGRPPEGRSNAVGGLISMCSRQGLCQRTGKMIKAKRPGMNQTELSEWIRK